MMAVENTKPRVSTGDFVEVSYTARLENGAVVDTTDPGVAAEADIADLTADGPVTVVLGSGHLFDPVERAIIDAGVGVSGSLTVPPDDAFGELEPGRKVSADIEHFPADRREVGEHVQYKGQTGFIESIDDGTATVNFNHPLAGSTIDYEFTVHRRVDEPLEQARGLLGLYGLSDRSSLELRTGEQGPVLEWSVTNPRAMDGWETAKPRAIDDLHRYIELETVHVRELHEAGRYDEDD